MLPIHKDYNLIKLYNFGCLVAFATEDKIIEILDSSFDVNYAVPHLPHVERYKDGCTALHFASYSFRQNNSIVQLLLNRGADFTRKCHDGSTPLYLAYRNEKSYSWSHLMHNPTIKTLLLAHIEFNIPTNPAYKNGISHFHIACETNNLEVTKFFLTSGVQVNDAIELNSKISPGCTGLHLAMHSGDKNMVELLLAHGADLTCLNADGKNPLHVFVEKQISGTFLSNTKEKNEQLTELLRNEDILNLLLIPNASMVQPIDMYGLSYFHICCTKKFNDPPGILETFIDNAADIHAPLNFDSPSCPGFTPLHFAAHSNLQTVLCLLKKGADLMIKDASGTTPFDICLDRFSPAEISQILMTQNSLKSIKLENGALLVDIISEFDTPNKLHDYLKVNEVNIRVPLDSSFWAGFTLLHLAVIMQKTNDESRIKVCLRHGVDLSVQDANKMTALHHAFYRKKKTCIDELLYASVNILVNLSDNNGLSYFHIACIVRNKKILEKFLKKGVDPNMVLQTDVQNIFQSLYQQSTFNIKLGSAPLHIVAACRSDELVELLLNHGANPVLPDADGLTWVHQAFFTYRDKWCESYLLQNLQTFKDNLVAPGELSFFHVACFTGNITAVQSLLPLQHDINQPIKGESKNYVRNTLNNYLGYTPLHLAVEADSVQVVEWLLKNGADVRAKNAKGSKPMHVALDKYCCNGQIIRLLLESEQKEKWLDDTGLTELHVACALKDRSLIEALLSRGEKPNTRIKLDSALWPGCAPLDILIRERNPEDNSAIKLILNYILKNWEAAVSKDQPLHGSAKCQKKFHLQKEEMMVNLHGLTVFHVSCMTDDSLIVEKFLNFGFDINEPSDYFHADEESGFTPLHFAVKYGRKNIVELLLRYGAEINCNCNLYNTVLHLAASENPDFLNLLLSGAPDFNIEARTIYGETVFDILLGNEDANTNHFIDILKCITRAKNFSSTAKIDLVTQLAFKFHADDFEKIVEFIPSIIDVDDGGQNIIHHIVQHEELSFIRRDCILNDFVKIIESLEKFGCDVDHQDIKGLTPLHWAVKNHSKLGVELLLLIGADINIVSKNDDTPFTSAFNCLFSHVLHNHRGRLMAAGLYLHPLNREYQVDKDQLRTFFDEVTKMHMVKISKSHCLRDVLTDNMVHQFPTMPGHQRRSILEFIESDELRQQFPGWIPQFKLQRRKALKRLTLFQWAMSSLQNLLDPRLPEHCLEFIMTCLHDDDWQVLTLIDNGH